MKAGHSRHSINTTCVRALKKPQQQMIARDVDQIIDKCIYKLIIVWWMMSIV